MRNRELIWVLGIIAVVALGARLGTWSRLTGRTMVTAGNHAASRPSSHPTSVFEVPGKKVAQRNAVDCPRPDVLHVTAVERDAAMNSLDEKLRQFRVKPAPDGSCTVVRLEKDSFMFHCGLRQGDIITHLNGSPLQTALRNHGGTSVSPVRIDVVRDGQRRAIEIHFDDSSQTYAAH